VNNFFRQRSCFCFLNPENDEAKKEDPSHATKMREFLALSFALLGRLAT
jgi:hypothetical protein